MLQAWHGKAPGWVSSSFRPGLALHQLCPRAHSQTPRGHPRSRSLSHWTLGTLGFNSLEGSFSGLSGQTHSHLLFQIFRESGSWAMGMGEGKGSRHPDPFASLQHSKCEDHHGTFLSNSPSPSTGMCSTPQFTRARDQRRRVINRGCGTEQSGRVNPSDVRAWPGRDGSGADKG